MGFEQIAWLPLCAGLTIIGLGLSWAAGRRRGTAAALRGIAWSLLPLAAYLTGVLPLLWNTGTAVAGWVVRLVFSPQVWVGAALAALSALLFLVSGALRGRALARGRAERPALTAGSRPGQPGAGPAALGATAPLGAGQPGPEQRGARQPASAPPADDDFAEVEEILRRRGIT